MKIVICGSINFSDKMIDIAHELKKSGHEVELPYMTKKIMDGEVTLEEYKKKKEESGDLSFRASASEDLIKRHSQLINESDSILVINVEKNGIANYIGGNSLLEMGFAHIFNKQIYLLNSIPELGYKDEMMAMQPTILNGDLSKIKEEQR